MPIPAFTYTPPAVTVIANGPLSTLQSAAPLKTILMLGTAPQGPDYPTLCTLADALNLYGNPANYATVGYDLPLAIRLASIQRQPTNQTGFRFLVCRAGVVRASTTVTGTGSAVAQIWTIVFSGASPSGNFTLTFGTQTTGNIAFSATAATLASNIQTALQALSNVGASNMTCAGSGSTPTWTITVTAAANLANLSLPNFSASALTGGTIASSITTPGVSYTQIYQLAISASATGGTFVLQYGSSTTSALAWNASAATIQAALVVASFWNTGQALVIPAPSVAGAFWIIAQGTFLNTQFTTPLVVNGANLTPTGGGGIGLSTINNGLTTGTAFVLQGVGSYAGSKGNGLALNIQGSGSAVTAITIYDITNLTLPVMKKQFLASAYNLSTNQFIANAINGANPLNNPYSLVQVSTIGSGSPTATTVSTSGAVLLNTGVYVIPLSGGTDGLGTTPSNDPGGTIPFLLQQSLWAYADYIYAGFDYTAIASTVNTHLTAALAQNQYRKAILGPKAGTLFSTLSGTGYSYVTANQTDRIVCIGHDSLYATSPITGNQIILDGYYAAAAFAGLKASGPTQETCTKFAISGFNGVAIPSDLVNTTNFLSQTQLNLLGSAGLLVFEQTLADGLLRVRDAITTAPYAFTGGSGGVNGGINVFSQFSMRDIDDAWSFAMTQALVPMLGRVFPSRAILQQAFTLACTAQAARLGSTIVDYSISVSLDPVTNQPLVIGNYVAPYPALQITIPTAFTLG